MYSDTFNLSFPKPAPAVSKQGLVIGNSVIKYILWFPAYAGTTSGFPLKDCGPVPTLSGNDDVLNFQYPAASSVGL
jgi:hypothetical protein